MMESGPVPQISRVEAINQRMKQDFLPMGYPTLVKVYGFHPVKRKGHVVFTHGEPVKHPVKHLINTVDRLADRKIRQVDDNRASNPQAIIDRIYRQDTSRFKVGSMVKAATRLLFPGAMRYRGRFAKIAEHARNLGLPYGSEKDMVGRTTGIINYDSQMYDHGVVFYDILRGQTKALHEPHTEPGQFLIQDAHIINRNGSITDLHQIDPLQAISQASRYLGDLHFRGGVGTYMGTSVIFQNVENNIASEPVLNIPDIVWNPKKHFSEQLKKATDVVDYLYYVGFASMQLFEKNGQPQWDGLQKAIDVAVAEYPDTQVLHTVQSLLKRGRPLFAQQDEQSHYQITPYPPIDKSIAVPKDPFDFHNNVRLGYEDIKVHFGIDNNQANVFSNQLTNSITSALVRRQQGVSNN